MHKWITFLFLFSRYEYVSFCKILRMYLEINWKIWGPFNESLMEENWSEYVHWVGQRHIWGSCFVVLGLRCSVGRRQKSDRDQYSQWGVNGTKLAIFSMLAVVYIFTVSSTYPRWKMKNLPWVDNCHDLPHAGEIRLSFLTISHNDPFGLFFNKNIQCLKTDMTTTTKDFFGSVIFIEIFIILFCCYLSFFVEELS